MDLYVYYGFIYKVVNIYKYVQLGILFLKFAKFYKHTL